MHLIFMYCSLNYKTSYNIIASYHNNLIYNSMQMVQNILSGYVKIRGFEQKRV